MSELLQAPDQPFGGPFRVQAVKVVATQFPVNGSITDDVEDDAQNLMGYRKRCLFDPDATRQPVKQGRQIIVFGVRDDSRRCTNPALRL